MPYTPRKLLLMSVAEAPKRLGVTVLRLGRLHGERAQKQQQLQDLDFEIALADGLRHGVELGKNVRHAL